MNNFNEAVMLWLPACLVKDDVEAVETVTIANGIILDFCDGEIGFEQALEELCDQRVNVDSYLENFEQSLRQFGA
jgi:hypothetical protein